MNARFRFPSRHWLALASWTLCGAASASTLPPWLLDDDGSCAATLITPRVAVSSHRCLGHVRAQGGAQHRLRQWSTGHLLQGTVLVDLRDLPEVVGYEQVSRAAGTTPAGQRGMPGQSLALFVLDAPSPALDNTTTPLPSYRQESRLLQDRTSDPTTLSLYVLPEAARPPNYPGAYVPRPQREGSYVMFRGSMDSAGKRSVRLVATVAHRPLVYRSMRKLAVEEPARFDLSDGPPRPLDGPGRDNLGRWLQVHMHLDALSGPKPVSLKLIDDTLVTTVGTAEDGMTRLWHPTAWEAQARRNVQYIDSPTRAHATSGAGLLASQGALVDMMVAVAVSPNFHLRLSAFLPAVYRELMARGLRGDALFLARQLLGQREEVETGRPQRIGDVRYLESPRTGQVEFFRRVAVDANGNAGAMPEDGRDNAHWEYLGTELPARREVATFLRTWQAVDREARAGSRYVRFNGGTGQVEYFKLKTDPGGGALPPLPAEATSNDAWHYLGTDLPVLRNRFADWQTTPLLSPLPGTDPGLPAPVAAR